MAYIIKNNISFNEYNAIINKVIEDCFVGGVYSPALYELSLRTSLVSAFVPDYDLSGCEDNNALWDKLTNVECENILQNIWSTIIYNDIVSAITQGINHRLRVIESSPMSLSDIALSKLFDIISDKVDSIDTNVLNKDTIEALITANKQSGKEGFEKKLVDEMVDRGLISKPNRATRRSNAKNKKDTKIIKIDTTKQEEQK